MWAQVNRERFRRTMHIQTEIVDGILLAKVRGSMNAAISLELANVPEIKAMDKPMILDLSGVDFMDSSGLGGLVKIVRNYKQDNQSLAFANPSTFVLKTLQMTRLDQVVRVTDSIEKAAKIIQEQVNA